jgi:FixJ family two-component response regulator
MTGIMPTLRQSKIIFVEDDTDVRRSITLMLRSRGFSVEAYRSGFELLSNRIVPNADCLLIDYIMPRIDGLDLLRQLRTKGLLAPALLITGFVSTTLNKRAQAAGFADVIEKPPPERLLVEKIQNLLRTVKIE